MLNLGIWNDGRKEGRDLEFTNLERWKEEIKRSRIYEFEMIEGKKEEISRIYEFGTMERRRSRF